ncbi:MAG: prepilin-type N-terminal cleavage/methylation domain-containing protein [Phycisphaera sp.]|nr:prepilin-type N-terminal cleavage/methylation domain-containing protein [Phycisphaera sp.]
MDTPRIKQTSSRIFGPSKDRFGIAPSHRSMRSAFTLIELLVVVSIISLLVSILLPALKKARYMAGSVVCLSHMRQQGLAFYSYVTDNKDVLPRGRDIQGGYKCGWHQVLPPYLNNDPGVWRCSNAQLEKSTGNHYSSNPAVMREIDSAAYASGVDNNIYSAIGRFSEVVMMFDGAQSQGGDTAADSGKNIENGAAWGRTYNPASSDNDQPVDIKSNSDDSSGHQKLRWREIGGFGPDPATAVINLLYADGHAQSKRYGEFVWKELRPDARK